MGRHQREKQLEIQGRLDGGPVPSAMSPSLNWLPFCSATQSGHSYVPDGPSALGRSRQAGTGEHLTLANFIEMRPVAPAVIAR